MGNVLEMEEMKMPKQNPQIGEQASPNYFLNLPKYNPNAPTTKGNVAGAMADITKTLAGTLASMQDRNDKIAMTAFERKLASMEKTLNMQAATANTIDTVDNLYKNYKEQVNNTAKEMLGDRLFGKWSQEQSTTYFDVTSDAMERAKMPILQKAGGIAIDELIEVSAKDRAMAPEEARGNIDKTVIEAIKYATYPKDGSMPIYDASTGAAKIKTYKNKADQIAVEQDALIDAKGAMNRLNTGYYKNLSAEQIQDYIPKLQKLVDKQEQSDLYEYAKAKYTDPKSGQVHYPSVVNYLNTQAEKEFNIKPENAKAATDMAIARLNRDEQLRKEQERQMLSNVYDKSFELYMNGEVENAIQYVTDSDIPWDDKHKIITQFSKGGDPSSSIGSGGTRKSNPQVFSDLAQRIVDEEIYDALPITREFALGNLTNADKENLIKLIGQVQEPSSTQYKRAMKQADNAIKSGLFGYKQVDEDTKAYIKNQLTQEYRNAVKDNKTLQEIETMFNPVRVNALVKQYVDEYPAIRESYEKQIQTEREEAEGTARVQREYENLQYDISKGIVKTHEDLKKRIDSIENNNTYYNTIEVQFDLEKQLQDRIDYYKGGVISAIPEQKLIITSAQESAAVHNATIAKPVLKLGIQPSKPGESIEEYTKRLMNK